MRIKHRDNRDAARAHAEKKLKTAATDNERRELLTLLVLADVSEQLETLNSNTMAAVIDKIAGGIKAAE